MDTIYHYTGLIVFWCLLAVVGSIFVIASIWFVIDVWVKAIGKFSTFKEVAKKVQQEKQRKTTKPQ